MTSDAFLDQAAERYRAIEATGKTLPWSEVRRYLEARVARRKTLRPRAKKLR